jgi:hypothetical protein
MTKSSEGKAMGSERSVGATEEQVCFVKIGRRAKPQKKAIPRDD